MTNIFFLLTDTCTGLCKLKCMLSHNRVCVCGKLEVGNSGGHWEKIIKIKNCRNEEYGNLAPAK